MAARDYDLEFDGYWSERAVGGIPNRSGVYCVYSGEDKGQHVDLRRLLYIGESGEVYDRIANHEKLSDWKRYLRVGEGLWFSFAPFESAGRERVEAALIFKHKPPSNDEHKDSFPFDETTIRTHGRNRDLSEGFTVWRTP